MKHAKRGGIAGPGADPVVLQQWVTIGTGQYEIHTENEYVDLPEFANGCRLAVALATPEI
jgi:hypothetical protein